nr:hypothetical protein [Tanacetum cinerariifolium]
MYEWILEFLLLDYEVTAVRHKLLLFCLVIWYCSVNAVSFWNTASVKRSDDVTRLQALVDKKNIVISEVVIREILQLDDAEGVVGKGFSVVETPLFEGMLAARQLAEEQVQADDAVDTAVQENVTKDVANDAIPSPPSHDIPSPS